MSLEELDTLRAEAAPAAAETATDGAPAVSEGEIMPPVDDGLKAALTGVVMGVGNLACARANVTGLEPPEADAMAGSIAQLIAVYDIGPKDPKGAAWMGFGMVALGVMGNRRPLPPKPAGEGAVAVPDDVPVPPAFGVAVNQSLGMVPVP